MDHKLREQTKLGYFSNVKTRLGTRLPTISQAGPTPPPKDSHVLIHLEGTRPRHYVPHIRNPQLRQYYLKETVLLLETTDEDLAGKEKVAGEGSDGMDTPVDTLLTVESQRNKTAGDSAKQNGVTLHEPSQEQCLHKPDAKSSPACLSSPSPAGGLASPSPDAEYDKLLDVEAVSMPDGHLCLLALPSECSEKEGPSAIPYLKLCCRHITYGKGVVSGILLVTPYKIFFDPYKSQPLVEEHGYEDYLLSCSVDSLASVTFSDMAHVNFGGVLKQTKEEKNQLRNTKRLLKLQGERRKAGVQALVSSSTSNLKVHAPESSKTESLLGGIVDRSSSAHEFAPNSGGILGAAVLSSAATFCCAGLDAQGEGDEAQQSWKVTADMPPHTPDSYDSLMFIRLRPKQPQKKRCVFGIDLKSAKGALVQDAFFSLSQDSSDELYAYLTHWRPDLCIQEGDDEEEEEEFVLVEDGEQKSYHSEGLTGDEWEMVSMEDGSVRLQVLDKEPEGMQDILEQTHILEKLHVKELSKELPARTVGHAWKLGFSTSRHGASLRTLYRKLAASESPVLIVIKDTEDKVFGAFLSHPLRLSEAFYGTGETFLFTLCPSYQCFHWSGDNSFFIKGDLDSFAIGGGSGHFGLWLDENLFLGRSSPCETFNNPSLSETDDFRVLNLEVWTFC